MAKIGYARVSSVDQNLDEQLDQLRNAGCEIIRSEKISGKSTEGREELANVLAFLRSGDELVITRLDRLGRSVKDLSNIVDDLIKRGITLKALHQAIDTSSAAGKAFLGMLSVFAEFENAIRSERQLEGIKRAKAAGAFKGRPSKVNLAELLEMRASGMDAEAICAATGLSRPTVYRHLAGHFASPGFRNKEKVKIDRIETGMDGTMNVIYSDGTSEAVVSHTST
jgi:DNA invertase Pin-like site-specific DNA recombinase